MRQDIWLMALEYEWMLRHHLLNELHQLFHGVPYEELHRRLTSIYRFKIPAYLYSACKKYRAGSGRFPSPPTGWRESVRGIMIITINPTCSSR